MSKTSLLVAFALILCGLVEGQPSSRILGGKDAKIGQFPHQIAIYLNGEFDCGGSIISSRHVLTAAHCVVNGTGIEAYPAEMFTIRVGSIQLMAGGHIVKVKKVTVRKSFGNWLDDIALLEFEKDLVFTKNIQKIDLFDGEVPSGAPVVISGWGRLTYGGINPQRLQYNIVTNLEASDCKKFLDMGKEQMLCLAHEEGNGSCNGDSGGPATYAGKLVGVSGFSIDGCGSKKPDGYSKVSYHREWIFANMS